jgi:hypothetical protein
VAEGNQVIAVRVTIRSDDGKLHPKETEGYAPRSDSALAVTQVHVHDSHNGWSIQKGRWNITHRPTGWHLGKSEWKSAQEAFAALLNCSPDFPGWLMATGTEGDMATLACKSFFRAAGGEFTAS